MHAPATREDVGNTFKGFIWLDLDSKIKQHDKIRKYFPCVPFQGHYVLMGLDFIGLNTEHAIPAGPL